MPINRDIGFDIHDDVCVGIYRKMNDISSEYKDFLGNGIVHGLEFEPLLLPRINIFPSTIFNNFLNLIFSFFE